MLININHYKIFCEIVISPSVLKRALKVSLIVGTTLNLINQGNSLVTLEYSHVSFIKLGLTYLVPYLVTTYTATAMKLEFQIGTKAVVEADLQCKKCGSLVHVKKDQLIPECKQCGIHTHWRVII